MTAEPIQHRSLRSLAHAGHAYFVNDRTWHGYAVGFTLRVPQPHDATTHGFDEFSKRSLHMAGLLPLVVRPFEVEFQDGDAPLIDDVRVEFAVAHVIGYHLAPTREANARTILFSNTLLHLGAIAMALGRSMKASRARQPEAATELDVIAPREA